MVEEAARGSAKSGIFMMVVVLLEGGSLKWSVEEAELQPCIGILKFSRDAMCLLPF